MPNEDQRAPSVADSTSRRYLLAVALMVVTIGAVTFVITRRDDSGNTNSSSPSRSEMAFASTTTRASDSKTEVVARLREILDVREQAFRERNAVLFEGVYSSDCTCLRAGRDAITALKKEKVRWKNRSISIEVQSARGVNDRLWEVMAIFVSNSFRIETEKGVLVRDVPGERLRYRFLLVRASDADPWLLGSASPVEG
jgi:hypothetical protein